MTTLKDGWKKLVEAKQRVWDKLHDGDVRAAWRNATFPFSILKWHRRRHLWILTHTKRILANNARAAVSGKPINCEKIITAVKEG